jgi:hypothetical protein
MKKLITFLSLAAMVALCVGLSSCKKDKDEDEVRDYLSKFKQGLVGSWKLDASKAGDATGWTTIADGPTITFNADGSCSVLYQRNTYTSYTIDEDKWTLVTLDGGATVMGYAVYFNETFYWTIVLTDDNTMKVSPKPDFDNINAGATYYEYKFVRVQR